MPENDSPSIGRQLLGAGVGSAIALAIYAGYTVTEPVITAYISRPQTTGEARFAQKDLNEKQYERQAMQNLQVGNHAAAPDADFFDNIADRAKEIEEALSEEQADEILQEEEVEEVMPIEDLLAPEETMEPAPLPDPAEWERELMEAQHEEFASEAPIPDSGVEHWISALLALALTMYAYRRKIGEYAGRLFV